MEFRVLGKLEALRDEEVVELGAFRQRALLALLLTSPNSVFSTDQLIDGLWGDDGSPDRQNSLWVYISGLRKALEPEREKRSDGTILLTRAPGYVLHTEADEVDAVRFERLVVEGKALALTDPGAASVVLGEALSMWRGRPYEEFTYESFAQAEIARLDGLRLEAVEARIDADLDRGMSRELVSELETLVRQHPLQEHLTSQLMQALYRSGRQADALRTYQTLRARLGEELGLEPGNSIQRLEAQMIAGDERLDHHLGKGRNGPSRQSGMAVRGYELRDEIREDEWGVTYRAYQPAVGREVAISVIRAELANDPEFIRNFEADAQLIARLEHPHIVPLHDFWREPDAAYVVTRLMSGGSLAGTLEQRALTAEEATGVLQQVGAAAELALRSSVRLPALTASNIVLDDEGNAYVSNVGVTSPDALADRTQAEVVADLGLVMAQAISGLSGEMVQVRGALTPPVRDVLDRATTFGDAPGFANIDAFADEMRSTVGLVDSPPESDEELVNPYKGLRSFEASDEKRFFGRERLIERLVARLGEPGTRGRFVTLVGPSGSGKSSVVKAGLLPALRNGALPLSDSWFTVSMTPAPHPFEELEDALRSIAVDPPSSMVDLLSGENGLHRAVERVLPDDASQLLLVIDQFEELFTQVDQGTATKFLDTLADAVNHDHSRLRVLITLRADFYDCPLRHRGVGELLREGTEAITPMTPEELERAIAGPAEMVGVSVEPTLMAELVTDVVDRPGALPLLQYALTELFDGRSSRRMTAEKYREIGGMSGALVDRADGLLARLGEHASDATRQIFLRLVTLGEGTDDTRRRVLRSELEQLSIDRRILEGVLDTFGRHRLLSFDRDPVTRGPTVEISHEALLTEWDRLHGWIDGARHDVRSQRRLAEAMSEWAAAGKSDEYLLRGGRLDQLGGWATTTSLPLSLHEQSFLDASVAERDRLEQEAHQREERAAAAELQANKRARQLAGAGVIGVLVAALAAFGIWQWRSAEAGRSDAETAQADAEVARGEAESAQAETELAKEDGDRLIAAAAYQSAADSALTEDAELSLLLAVEAVRTTAELGFATEEAVDSLHWALQRLGVHYPADTNAAAAVRSGPTGLTGVYVLPPAQLVALAEGSTQRRLTDQECLDASGTACSLPVEIDADLPLRFGVENYQVEIPEVLPGVAAFGGGPLAGTRVTLAAVGTVTDLEGMNVELADFSNRTGIEVEILSNFDFDLTAQLSTGQVESFPDVAGLFQPPQPWARSRAVDLTTFLDDETLRSDFGDYLVDLASTGQKLHAIPMSVQPKGMVYYPKRAFDAAGYEIPNTWDELIDLSQQLVDDGHDPWCFQWEAGFASGFAGSDFLENLMVRTSMLDRYDDWAALRSPFDSPDVLEAALVGEEILFAPNFVRGGPKSISSQFFGLVNTRLLELDPLTGIEGPQCWLVHGTAQMADLLGPDTEIGPGGRLGEDVDFFMLPPVVGTDPAPVTGGGLFAAAMTDRPEIRALMEYIASPDWGRLWSGSDGVGDTFVSANARFDTSNYSGVLGPETGRTLPREQANTDVRLAIHEVQRAALESETWRYDASDLMPTNFGAWTDDFVPGPFWQGMIDWVDQKKPIDEILAEIEAQRPDATS